MKQLAKILKFPPPKNPLEGQTVKAVFADYEPSENCCNTESYGQLCVKCGRCGRRFVDGILQKGGAE